MSELPTTRPEPCPSLPRTPFVSSQGRRALAGVSKDNFPDPYLDRVEKFCIKINSYGRMSTVMTRASSDRIELLQGTLDMLVLRTLLFGPAHGHAIAKHIQRTTEEVLQVEHGSLYPALHRLERRGWIASKWEKAKDRNRDFKYYRLTPAGKKQLAAQESKWKQMATAIARVMSPV